MPEIVVKYSKRFDTLLKKWVLERHEGTNVKFVATYPETEEGTLNKVLNVLNDRGIDVA